MIVGSMCVDMSGDSSMLEISFHAADGWGLVTTEFWVGDNVAGVPNDEDGGLDVERFPCCWCNSTGEKAHSTHVDFKWSYLCEEETGFSLAFVAQLTFGKLSKSGKIVEGTETATFATEQHVETLEGAFGWFDVPVVCDCVEKRLIPECIDSSPMMPKPECHDVVAGDSMIVGSMCVDMSGDASMLEISFDAADGWGLVTTEFWVGDNATGVPSGEDGGLDAERFPCCWCNSTGQKTLSTHIDFKWSYLCEEETGFSLAFVAQLTFGKMSKSGKIIEGTEVATFATERCVETLEGSFGWFDVPVLCGNCTEKTHVPECIDSSPMMPKPECHDVVAGDSMIVGSMCVDMSGDSSMLEISFDAADGWGLVTTEFWVGDSIAGVPKDEDGGLDVERFPCCWCNSTGEKTHSTHVDFKWSYLCEEETGFSLAFVAQLTFGKLTKSGKVLEGTEMATFATEHCMETVEGSFGWIGVPVVCDCGEKKQLPECIDSSPMMAKLLETPLLGPCVLTCWVIPACLRFPLMRLMDGVL